MDTENNKNNLSGASDEARNAEQTTDISAPAADTAPEAKDPAAMDKAALKKTDPVKPSGKKPDKKKLAVIIAVCVLAAALIVGCVLWFTLGGSRKAADDTGAAVTETDKDGKPVVTTAPAETDKDGKPLETTAPDETDAQGNPVITPATEPADPDDPDAPVDTSAPETEIVVAPGKDESSWPSDKLPDSVPAFTGKLTFSNNCVYEGGDGQETWFLGWDTNAADYEKWLATLTAKGFIKSNEVSNFWGDGKIVMDISTEDNADGSLWVSLDIYRAPELKLPAAAGKALPLIATDATVFYWEENPTGTLTANYVCAKDWELDLVQYRTLLQSKGFTVNDNDAVKTVDGKTYTVRWAGEGISDPYNTLIFTY